MGTKHLTSMSSKALCAMAAGYDPRASCESAFNGTSHYRWQSGKICEPPRGPRDYKYFAYTRIIMDWMHLACQRDEHTDSPRRAHAPAGGAEDKRNNWLASGNCGWPHVTMKLLREKVYPNFSTVTKATRWNPTLRDKILIMLKMLKLTLLHVVHATRSACTQQQDNERLQGQGGHWVWPSFGSA